MRYLKTICLLVLACLTTGLFAQRSVVDSSITIPSFNITFGAHKPGGDMADRFYENAALGFNFTFKTPSNFVFGAEGSYLFGPSHHQENFMHTIKNQYGDIMDIEGEVATVLEQQRGFNAFVFAGKVLPIIGPNPNSGLMLKAGVGLLQHRIWIENRVNTIPQLEKEYKKGYDRLTNGLAIEQFIGYQHFSDNRLINYFIGFEFIQGFTQSRRDYNFDLMAPDKTNRLDLMFGIKAGWAIPIYKRAPLEYYSE